MNEKLQRSSQDAIEAIANARGAMADYRSQRNLMLADWIRSVDSLGELSDSANQIEKEDREVDVILVGENIHRHIPRELLEVFEVVPSSLIPIDAFYVMYKTEYAGYQPSPLI